MDFASELELLDNQGDDEEIGQIEGILKAVGNLLSKLSKGQSGHIGERIGFKVQVRDYEPVHAEIWGQLSCSNETMEEVYTDLHSFLDQALSEIRKKLDAYVADISQKGQRTE